MAKKVRFVGSDKTSLPMNWRVGESLAALHALEAALVNVLLEKRYSVASAKIEINT